MGPKLTGLYDRTILAHPRLTLFLLALVVAAIGYNAKNFRLDASEDTLILEGDEDLRYFRSISEDYNTPTFLVVTVQTEEDIFSPASLGMLRELRDRLDNLEGAEDVVSILDVPLLRSPPVPLGNFARTQRHCERSGRILLWPKLSL